MGSFLSDAFLKSFSSKYVYVEAATTTAVAPSHVLSPVYTVLYMFSHCQFFKNGAGVGGMVATSDTTSRRTAEI
jgi:hypothetical protein